MEIFYEKYEKKNWKGRYPKYLQNQDSKVEKKIVDKVNGAVNQDPNHDSNAKLCVKCIAA